MITLHLLRFRRFCSTLWRSRPIIGEPETKADRTFRHSNTRSPEMEFQEKLLKVDQALSRDDTKALAFLCKDILKCDIRLVESPIDLFQRLEEKDVLSEDQPYLLADLLCVIEHFQLLRELDLNSKVSTTESLISPYRKLLYQLSEGIGKKELEKIKFLLTKDLQCSALELNVCTLEVFLAMERKDILSSANLIRLEQILDGYPVLGKRIEQFKALQEKIAQETGLVDSRPTASLDASRRGKAQQRDFCWIFNIADCSRSRGQYNNHFKKNRQVDVVKVMGKRGLCYRGDKAEAAYTLENTAVNHGNFLDLQLLISRFIEQSKEHHDGGAKGREAVVTLMSKDIVNKVLENLGKWIKCTIADEVRAAGMFSVQIDTTQVNTSTDQCAIIVRYVTDTIHERLVSVVDCENSTGRYFADLLKQTLDDLSIDISTCVGNSTDGAANMQGQYQGFSALLSKNSPTQIHVWCYGHVLNLVLADTTGSVIESASLFTVLNDVVVFLRESWKRIEMCEKTSEDKSHRILGLIGATKLWANDQALIKVFGYFGDPKDAFYVDLLLTLASVVGDKTMTSSVRAKAMGHINHLLKYEVILTAQIFLRIFQATTPLSNYLQTHGMDILTSQRLVEGTQDSLSKYVRDFKGVKGAADMFVSWANEKLEDVGSDLVLESALPEKCLRKKKRMPGELMEDDPVASPDVSYEINIHNIILDTVLSSIDTRFSANAKLVSDFACLNPKNFLEVRKNGLPNAALTEISRCLIRFDDRATVCALRCELYSLASQWEKLKRSPLEGYTVRIGTEDSGPDGRFTEPKMELDSRACSSCQNCAICVHLILSQYNLLQDAYHIIGLAYKFFLTLSSSPVACERSFSTLKFVKNRLRSSMSQEHLEAFMLMRTEKEILMSLDN